MRNAIALFLLMFASATMAQDFAMRVPCETAVDKPSPQLRTLYWQQGTTPLIQFDQLAYGRAVTADTNMVARMIIGQSATSAVYATTNSYFVTNNSFYVQWPTVGTNSGTNAWWYTVYFEKSGNRYWTGNGRLYITATTSTDQDGLTWMPITTSGQVAAHNTNTGAHADIRAQLTNVTDTTARALAASNTALIVAETNRAIQAESGINATATNALTIGTNALAGVQELQAAGYITAGQASNLTAAIMATGTTHYATTAGGIAFEGEGSSLTIIPSNGVLHVRTVTNSVAVYVSATSGDGYSGPAVGTVWANPVATENVYSWDYGNTFNLFLDVGPGGILQNGGAWTLDDSSQPPGTTGYAYPGSLPGAFAAYPGYNGTATLAWVPVTNTYTIGDMTGYLRHTNSTGYGDGVLNGTNGVYWTKNGTNYWILLD